MASTVTYTFAEGQTTTLILYPDGSDAPANGAGDAGVAATNRKWLYTATVAETLSGLHRAAISVAGKVVAEGWVKMTDGAENEVKQTREEAAFAQTGDGYAYLTTNLGALGANASEAGGTGDHLTALGDTRLANLNATVGSRSSHAAADVAALVLAAPANKLATDVSGYVTPTSASKTGYSLTATGLDAIASPDDLTPGVVPSTFTEKLRWMIQRFWKADKTPSSISVKNEAGQTITTQVALDDEAGTESLGRPL